MEFPADFLSLGRGSVPTICEKFVVGKYIRAESTHRIFIHRSPSF